MKPRVVSFIMLAVIGACSGVNVKLGATHAGEGVTGGSANASGGDTGFGGTLNLGDAAVGPILCPNGTHTTVSGKVWDPGQHVPLYNAVVFVPDGPLPPLGSSVACESCKEFLPAFDVALSDSSGSFVLDDVPALPSVDLVVQLGKWRSKPQSFAITPCKDNLIDGTELHLPRDKSEGDLPKIALSTGHSDALECLLRKIGISDSEFTTDQGDGRVNMFVGCQGDQTNSHTGAAKFSDGTPFPSTNKLFDTPGELDNYDVVIFSCEGHKCTDPQPSGEPAIQSPTHVAQLIDFANRGGRVYLDHDHYNWLNHAGNVPNAAAIDKATEAAANFSASPSGIPSPLTAQINTASTFPKGQAFAQWLVNVGASTTLGSLDIYSSKTSAQTLDPNRAQSWIYRDPSQMYPDNFYFTIGTPVAIPDNTPATTTCGRMVFTDLHVSKSGGGCMPGAVCGESDDVSDQDIPFPGGCGGGRLLPQEMALEFMIFDLTSCVQKETDVPTPPIPK